jgi:hypothetical protein
MENIPDSSLPSSQPESEPDLIFSSSQYFPSSPPSIISEVDSCRKPKKPAPVTPRSFRRFFTPRSALGTLHNGESIRTNRRALQEIAGPALNRSGPALARTSDKAESRIEPQSHAKEVNLTPAKKRKFTSTFDNPLSSSPLRKVRVAPPIHEEPVEEEERNSYDNVIGGNIHIEPSKFKKERTPQKLTPVQPIRRSAILQTSGALFARSLSDRRSKVTIRSSNYGASWQDETSNFYSRPDDLHACINQNRDHMALPFCTTACNSKLIHTVYLFLPEFNANAI